MSVENKSSGLLRVHRVIEASAKKGWTCIQCGKKMEASEGGLFGKKRFCSETCRNIWWGSGMTDNGEY